VHRLVVDTNIIISSLLGKSYPYKIVFEVILDKKALIFLSSEILKEYKDVVSRKKFHKSPGFIQESIELIQKIERVSTVVTPALNLDLLKDSDDNRFLELALTIQVDYLITGNSKDFPFGKIENTQIVSPQKYWTTHWA